MFTVTVSEKGGSVTVREFDQPEVTIGRIQGNDIVLAKSNISKRHARIINNANSFVIVDSKSTNGTYVNGKRIDAPYDLRVGDKIFIGDFTLEVEPAEQKRPSRDRTNAPPPPPAPEPRANVPAQEENDALLADDEWGAGSDLEQDWADDWGSSELESDGTEASKNVDPAADFFEDALADKLEPEAAEKPPPPPRHRKAPSRKIEPTRRASRPSPAMELPRGSGRSQAAPRPSSPPRSEGPGVGLGPLGELYDDPSVTEIMVNGPAEVFVERGGHIEQVDCQFSDGAALLQLLESIAASVGGQLDAHNPICDARLPDGSRFNAVIPPLSRKGPTLAIRKFNHEPLQVDDLVASGTLTADMAEFLEMTVKARRSTLIAGGAGAGKTTTLNILASEIPEGERIITVEEAAELKLEQPHVVSLEACLPSTVGQGGITTRDLIRNAQRMRPDRIVVGECRGGEVLDFLQAVNSGFEGSLSSVHANSPRDAIARLETMALLSGVNLPARAVRELVATGIHIVVQLVRFADGSRRITHISEISRSGDDGPKIDDIFVFEQNGYDATGKVSGRHQPTGHVPEFYRGLKAMGMPASEEIFLAS